MAARRRGLLGSLRNKLLARIASVLASGGTTSAFMYCERLVALLPQGEGNQRIENAEALSVRLARSGGLLSTKIEARRGTAAMHAEVTRASDTSLNVRHALR